MPSSIDTTVGVGADSAAPVMARSLRVRLLLLLVLASAAVLFPKLAMPACFFCLVASVANPRLSGRARSSARALLLLAWSLSGVGLLRFALEDAIPGVIAGGQSATSKQAVSFLRTIVAAQDRARVRGHFDPDGDGIGSALTLHELSGLTPLPAGRSLEGRLLALTPEQFVDTAQGPAVRHAGYLFSLCLPTSGGGFSTRPLEERDVETAERRYLLYAWPERMGPGAPREAYFADEHERILLLSFEPTSPRYVGVTQPPRCEAALNESDWVRWKEKNARKELPGDTAH